MNKKLLVVSILAVFMLVAISFSTAVSSNSTDGNRESPLFRIRTRKAIGERLGELKEAIKARFIGERVFFLPFTMREGRTVMNLWSIIQANNCPDYDNTIDYFTCGWTYCYEKGCYTDYYECTMEICQ